MDAGPVGEPDPYGRLQLVVETSERAAHPVCRAHRAKSVVLVECRQPETPHDRVPDVLLDEAAMALDLGPHGIDVAAHHLAESLGVERLAEGSGAFEVGEDDRHRLPDFGRRLGWCEGRAAETA